jgi:hypothetical protein
MNLLWIAIISSIPACISILLFLLRNRILPQQVANGVSDAAEAGYGSPTEINPSRLARLIPPQEKLRSVPASSQSERPLTGRQRKANNKAVKNFTKGFYSEATEIVKRSLNNGDSRWSTLRDALEAEAQNYQSPGKTLTTDIYATWLYNKEVTDIETASRCLVFGTWYTHIINKPDEKKVRPTLADTWRQMGNTYIQLPKLLNRPEANFQSDAQDCFSKAHMIAYAKNEKGEAQMHNL